MIIAVNFMIMSEIRFYHLQRQSVFDALPPLLSKALSVGKRIYIGAANDALATQLDEYLWTYRAEQFLPHNLAADENAALSPVVISSDVQGVPANQADMYVSVGGAALPEDLSAYGLLCYVFDGQDAAALTDARALWKSLKDSDADLTYWQQGDTGWQKKA